MLKKVLSRFRHRLISVLAASWLELGGIRGNIYTDVSPEWPDIVGVISGLGIGPLMTHSCSALCHCSRTFQQCFHEIIWIQHIRVIHRTIALMNFLFI